MQIKDFKKLTDEKWLNLFGVRYVARSGDEKSWKIATRQKEPKCVTGSYERPDAVVIVPFHKVKDKMVITREYRVPLNDYEYGFPAGLVDDGESVEQATRRELREETGLTVNRIIKSSPPIYSSAGMTDESVAMVYVECEGEPSNSANTESELIETLFISPDEALRLLSDPTLKFDAKAWLAISQFAENNR
ncbi:MAG: NUDIX hydrolase [Desulfobacterales bacterium]|nr:NUDIX hydrolase [Desulfobacterales bacterium]